MNKRASTSDAVVWMIMLLMMFMAFPIGYMLMTDFNTIIQAEGIGTNETLAMTQDFTNRYPSWGDGIFVFLVFGMLLATALFAWFVDTNPALFFIGIIVIAIMAIVAAILSNVASLYSDNRTIMSFVSAFPMMNTIMDNFVFVIIGWVFVVAVILWSKLR